MHRSNFRLSLTTAITMTSRDDGDYNGRENPSGGPSMPTGTERQQSITRTRLVTRRKVDRVSAIITHRISLEGGEGEATGWPMYRRHVSGTFHVVRCPLVLCAEKLCPGKPLSHRQKGHTGCLAEVRPSSHTSDHLCIASVYVLGRMVDILSPFPRGIWRKEEGSTMEELDL
ncbi:NADH dehydrogenase subunit E [Anopheles sinensis]|uniref:NADH dehydrogenase subunit E n=1 Tax=Anopheles sinensis TaxID=74873 RepID=A0A084WM17_ANOSI|nr:NADH dehydrogenase subunit E [Anopheles sinensis]